MILHPSLSCALEVIDAAREQESSFNLSRNDLLVETFRQGISGLSISNAITAQRALVYVDPSDGHIVLAWGSEAQFDPQTGHAVGTLKSARWPSDDVKPAAIHLLQILT